MKNVLPPSVPVEAKNEILIKAGVVSGITLFALILRLSYLYQIQSIPLFSHLIADSFGYDQWGRSIAEGNLRGEGIFYQAPLYPYFLGLVYYLFGHSLWDLRVIQAALGAVSCGLLYIAGRLFFTPAVGIVAGLILALYAPAIFFDGVIQKSVLDLFLVVLLLVVLGLSLKTPTAIKSLTAGALVGLLGLTRENALLWAPVMIVWFWAYFPSHSLARRLGWSGLFLSGICLVMAPVGLRNLKVGGEFVLTTSQMGTNFYIGNNPSADGTYASLKPGRGDPQFERVDAQELAERALSRSLTATQVSNYWFGRGWEYIRARPFEWLSLFGRKWLITWNVREIEDSDDFYIYQQWSALLKGLATVGNFGFLAPLAAVGVLLTLKDSRRMAILYGLILAMAFSVALFYVFGRYRYPLIPMLALFAGAGVVRLCNLATTKQLSWLLGAAATAILAWFIVHWPVVGKPGPTVAGYSNLARVFAKTGQSEEAIKNYRQALQLDSQNPVAHYNLGSLLGMQGSAEEAKLHLEQAIKFAPGYAEAHANLGNVLLMLGSSREAIERYRKALELDPNFDDTRSNLGMALLQGKDFDGAAEQFKLLLKKRPDDVKAHFLLANALAARGQLNEAIGEFRAVLRLEPEHEKAHVGLARALAMAGRAEEAIEQYQRALALLKSQRESGGPGK